MSDDFMTPLYRGPLKEIDKVSINEFSKGCCAYFVTHLDDDILDEFFNSGFISETLLEGTGAKLYVHRIAYEFLLYWASTSMKIANGDQEKTVLEKMKSVGKIILLETNHTTEIPIPDVGNVSVTALSSGHNAGSIMLLIELPSGDRILYTGKCRMNLRDLRYCSALLNEDGKVKDLKTVYLDTTFVRHNVEELPSRREVIMDLCGKMKMFADSDRSRAFDIDTGFAGAHLAVLKGICDNNKEPVHVPKALQDFFRACMPALANAVNSSLCENGKKHMRYHFGCGDANDHEECTTEDWAVNFDVKEVQLVCDFSHHIEGEESSWKSNRESVFSQHPCWLFAIYSSHLSHFEAARMVNFLGILPTNVRPLFLSQSLDENEVVALLDQTCGSVPMQDFGADYPSFFHDFTSYTASGSSELSS